MKQQPIQQLFDRAKLRLTLDQCYQNTQNPKANWALHYYYELGLVEVTVDLEKRLTCLEIAAQQGHAGASYKLALYFSTQKDLRHMEVIYNYISEEHIQKCIDNTDECNDLPYYSQQEYIELLQDLKDQFRKNPSDKPDINTIRHRTSHKFPPPSCF